LSDGNENVGDAFAAVLAARPLGVTVDVVPLGVARGGDVSVQKLSLPANIKKGQTFEVKIFVQSDQAQRATLRLFLNNQLFGEQPVQLEAGKNLFSFPQTLTEPNFYSYEVQIEAPGIPCRKTIARSISRRFEATRGYCSYRPSRTKMPRWQRHCVLRTWT